jgi:hypothetical protein
MADNSERGIVDKENYRALEWRAEFGESPAGEGAAN